MENLEGAIIDLEKNETDKAEMQGSEPEKESASSSEGILTPPTDPAALDESFRQEDADALTQATFRFTWHGKDIVGNEYTGFGNTTAECHEAAASAGAANCFNEPNPAFIEPEAPTPEPKPISAFEANDFYSQGYADGDAAYQDIKLLILAWVSEQMLSSSLNMAQDIDSIPFVVYARHNR